MKGQSPSGANGGCAAPVPTRGEIDWGRWRAYPSNGRHPRRSRRAGAPGRAGDDAAGTRACGPPGGPRAGLTSAGGAGRRPTREWILWETTRKDVDDRDHDGSSFRGNLPAQISSEGARPGRAKRDVHAARRASILQSCPQTRPRANQGPPPRRHGPALRRHPRRIVALKTARVAENLLRRRSAADA